jgi:hypothetical protein
LFLLLVAPLVSVPYQEGGWDCGVFVCKYALSILTLARNNSLTYATAQVGRAEGGIAGSDDGTPCPFTELVTESEEFSFGMDYILHLRRDMKTLLERLSNIYQDWKKQQNVPTRDMIQLAREEGASSKDKPKINSGATCDRIQGANEEGASREEKPKTVATRDMIQLAREEGTSRKSKPKTDSGATCDRIQGANEEGASREEKPKTGGEFLCAHDCIAIL